ncbi:protein SprT [Agarivorans sp. Toyoura001]|uniref:SprT family zinc-dependent metalloprotease n=1 Tax=Agarivorans sp. Toyoura001 TaxID=2283141 RepID=UPI0010E69640|nr:SprT family zinc-dependent metalloprotease [Agarivorans sp. Toyoura001]GDY28200.1 protein SprT [Agarivorans sp. Toyoura001]
MQRLNQTVENCFIQAETFFERTFTRPEILLSARNSKVAGSANLSRWRLRFNAHFYQQQPEHFLAQTVPHEVAHIICHAVYGRVKPHGKEWQAIMLNVFNCPPHTTHNYSLESIKINSVEYRCACQSHLLSIRRHNKVLKGASYQCRTCRQVLQISQ